MVTVPLRVIGSVPVEPLNGKVVIDTNNYYPQRDGHIAELDSEAEWTPPPVNGPPGLRYRDAPHDTERAVS